MKVHLRDLKDGPFEITDSIEYDASYEMDERIHDVKLLNATVKGNKFSDSIVLDVSIVSKIGIDCDRCSDEIDYDVSDSFSVLMTKNSNLSEFNHKDFDVVIEIKEDDIDVDLTPYLFEGINVSLPMRLAPVENDKGECSVCLKTFDYQAPQQSEKHRKEFEKLKKLFK